MDFLYPSTSAEDQNVELTFLFRRYLKFFSEAVKSKVHLIILTIEKRFLTVGGRNTGVSSQPSVSQVLSSGTFSEIFSSLMHITVDGPSSFPAYLVFTP